ncbi:MAG: sulfurtransferase [Thermus sp.]|uniref:sulfurtransferase n=1 Tax=Thermus sp. TaxID=275 RepID=UPI003D146B7D
MAYAHPEVLVSTEWVEEHLKDPRVRVLEVDEDILLYETGHIPGAKNIPWAKAGNPDGTFKSAEELRALYEPLGVTKDKDVVVYCRIAERSSHSWFVLKYLLGYPRVKNYDGSWTEWGNLVGVPIAKGEE